MASDSLKIPVSLLFLNWIKNEMIFYHFSELILSTLIQRYDKKKIILFQEREINRNNRLSGAPFYDFINTIYQFIKPFLDNKMSISEEYGAFNANSVVPIMCHILWHLICVYTVCQCPFYGMLGTNELNEVGRHLNSLPYLS